jgi:diazepam-binding inhibitor (GABA receptor modulating acyl-CoA-binding protein)
MSAPQSEAFKTAAADSKKLTSKPNNDELLELYGTPPSTTISQKRPF